MKVTEVEIRDVMKVQFVSLSPEDHLTIIGGKNEQGKTSLLNAVAMALGGKKLCPAKPIRTGKDFGIVKVKISGDDSLLLPPSTVIRRFFQREDGTIKSELEIVSDDGFQAPEPQTLLNRILSNATFDPLYFTRLKPADQAAALRELLGLDVSQLDAKRASLFATRTVTGREVKQLQGHLDSLPAIHEGVPEAPVSAADVAAELAEAQQRNAENQQVRQAAVECLRQRDATLDQIKHIADDIESLRAEIAELERTRESKNAVLARQRAELQDAQAKADARRDVDLSTFKARLEQVDAINARVRQNEKRKEVAAALSGAQAKYEALTGDIADIDAEKTRLLETAKWPITGLGFEEDGGVTYNGVPFEQCSSAEQLRVSVAIGFALNPKLKLLLIRDGSLLDDESLCRVAQMAAENDGQVFLERVGEGSECHLVMRDGAAADAETEETAEAATE